MYSFASIIPLLSEPVEVDVGVTRNTFQEEPFKTVHFSQL
jgi:hypothetical protein